MEKGLALVAIVIGAVALLIAGMTVLPQQSVEADNGNQASRLTHMRQRLDRLQMQLQESEAEVQKLARRLSLLEENVMGVVEAAKGESTSIPPHVRDALQEEVQGLMKEAFERARRGDVELAGAGRKFESMMDELVRSVKATGNDAQLIRNHLTIAHGEIAQVREQYPDPGDLQKRQAALQRVRSSLDRRLEQVLTETLFERYTLWKENKRQEPGETFAKEFFGLH